MQTLSINTAQQLVADRQAGYEGVASRRRLRKLARRNPRGATGEALSAPDPTARIVAPRIPAPSSAAERKPESRKPESRKPESRKVA
jgi:hypothetical protein